MTHLNFRMRDDDLRNLALLQQVWGMDRSETARKALALAAESARAAASVSKSEILSNSRFVGRESEFESPRKDYRNSLRRCIKKKHGL